MDQFIKSTCTLEVMLPIKQDDDEKRDGLLEWGGFRAAVTHHFGDYNSISNTHMQLLRWIGQNGYTVNGLVSEEYLISPLDVTIAGGYVTKVIIPVK